MAKPVPALPLAFFAPFIIREGRCSNQQFNIMNLFVRIVNCYIQFSKIWAKTRTRGLNLRLKINSNNPSSNLKIIRERAKAPNRLKANPFPPLFDRYYISLAPFPSASPLKQRPIAIESLFDCTVAPFNRNVEAMRSSHNALSSRPSFHDLFALGEHVRTPTREKSRVPAMCPRFRLFNAAPS